MQFLPRNSRSASAVAMIGIPIATSGLLIGWQQGHHDGSRSLSSSTRTQHFGLAAGQSGGSGIQRRFHTTGSNRNEEQVASPVVLLASSASATIGAGGGGSFFDGGGSTRSHNSTEYSGRPRQTSVDRYFLKHGNFEDPKVPHMVLPPTPNEENSKEKELPTATSKSASKGVTSCDDTASKKNILVIGDVHGCFEEMLELHDKALKENGNKPFDYVILVGDMCNKGPDSAKVVHWVRTQPNWYSVRGNHDDKALLAALGDPTRTTKKKYRWISEKGLSDEDVVWMSQLPYTITIPGSYLGEDADTLIVHAGLIPNRALERQIVDTMVTLRNVMPIGQQQPENNDTRYIHFGGKVKRTESENGVPAISDKPMPWASQWKGPQKVIFGHDARRGLQQYDNDWALGLDTGAVYGHGMTGVILPHRKLVKIETQVHQSVAAGDE